LGIAVFAEAVAASINKKYFDQPTLLPVQPSFVEKHNLELWFCKNFVIW
jgi:hypothetical protein